MQVAYVVHNANGLSRRTCAEMGWIRHACASSDNVDQRGAVSRRFPKKKFSDLPLCPRRKRGGGAYRGEKLISENRVANCTLPCWTLSGVGYGRAQHRHLPNRRSGPTQCTSDASDAHGGRARGRAHEEVAAPILQQPRLSETDAMNGDSGPHPRTPRPSPMRQEVGTSVVRRGNPRCGDANRRTAVVRLRTACASAARAAGPVLGLSHFSPPWCGMWRKCTVGQRVAGGATRDVAMQTGGQLSSD